MASQASWDERVGSHREAEACDFAALREGRAALHPIEAAEIGDVAGPRIAHLRCHFGRDCLTLAQNGAEVVGIDFSGAAIAVARRLADELGLAERARLVAADLSDAPAALAGHEYWWDHQLGDILTALAGAGLRLHWVHENDSVARQMYVEADPAPGALFRWPKQRRLPLAVSLSATKRC